MTQRAKRSKVSVDIASGRMIGVIGPDGVAKSTLACAASRRA